MKKPERAPGFREIVANKRLFELLRSSSDQLEALFEKIQKEYLPWDKIKYLPTPPAISKDDLWALTKFRRFSSGQTLTIGGYIFRYTITPHIQMALHEFDMKYGGQIGASNPLQQADRQQYLISSIMEEAIASSQIEGAVTTRIDAKAMLKNNQPPRNRSERMILNNYRTIQHIREIKEKTLTPERLTEIQKLMTSDTLDNPADEGRFRDNDDVRVIDVVDGEIMHQPPNVSQLPKLIEELCQFVNDDEERMFIHPIIKASIIHFLIGFIHPFVDGNGRTARALFYWYMLKKGYWLTEYLSISSIILKAKTQYANAFLLTETDENDLSYFIQFKIKTMKLAYAGLQKYLQRKIEEKKAATTFLTIGGINERQALLLQELTMEADKVLRVVELENRFGVSNQTARNDLKALKSLGLLKSTKINKKESIFSRSASFESRVEQLKSQSLA